MERFSNNPYRINAVTVPSVLSTLRNENNQLRHELVKLESRLESSKQKQRALQNRLACQGKNETMQKEQRYCFTAQKIAGRVEQLTEAIATFEEAAQHTANFDAGSGSRTQLLYSHHKFQKALSSLARENQETHSKLRAEQKARQRAQKEVEDLKRQLQQAKKEAKTLSRTATAERKSRRRSTVGRRSVSSLGFIFNDSSTSDQSVAIQEHHTNQEPTTTKMESDRTLPTLPAQPNTSTTPLASTNANSSSEPAETSSPRGRKGSTASVSRRNSTIASKPLSNIPIVHNVVKDFQHIVKDGYLLRSDHTFREFFDRKLAKRKDPAISLLLWWCSVGERFVHSCSSTSQLVSIVSDALCKRIGCESCSIFIVNKSISQEMRRASTGSKYLNRQEKPLLWTLHHNTKQKLWFSGFKGTAAHVALTGTTISFGRGIPDNTFDPTIDARVGGTVKSMITCPIFEQGKDEPIAVLQAVNKSEEQSFSREDVFIVTVFNQAVSPSFSRAIENDRLKAKSQLAQLSSQIPFQISTLVLEDLEQISARTSCKKANLMQAECEERAKHIIASLEDVCSTQLSQLFGSQVLCRTVLFGRVVNYICNGRTTTKKPFAKASIPDQYLTWLTRKEVKGGYDYDACSAEWTSRKFTPHCFVGSAVTDLKEVGCFIDPKNHQMYNSNIDMDPRESNAMVTTPLFHRHPGNTDIGKFESANWLSCDSINHEMQPIGVLQTCLRINDDDELRHRIQFGKPLQNEEVIQLCRSVAAASYVTIALLCGGLI